ncbi:MAG: outer membrane protein [Burkholderiales bacterium]|nr:outer membrane beta-barrel protein [Burkholderiales bacterium]MDQ3196281.1 porin family protein [Pseudomonadota bacterium]
MDISGTAEASVHGLNVSAPFRAQLFEVDTDDSYLIGLRAGYWFGFAPNIGIALEAFHFRPDIKNQTVDAFATTNVLIEEIFDQRISIGVGAPVTLSQEDVPAVAFSPDLRVRWRLFPKTDIPNGQIQPYIMAGPAFLLTSDEDFETPLGVKVGGGVTWQFHRNFALFGEYRFTHFAPEIEHEGVDFAIDLDTHAIVTGVSFRF